MSHEHELNRCVVAGCAENPTSRSLRSVLSFATIANIGYGAFSVLAGIASGSSAVFADGIHSVSDGYSHAMHTATHKAEQTYSVVETEQSAHAIQLKRRLAAVAIAAGAIASGYQAIDHFVHRDQAELNYPALAVELGALALNGSLLFLVSRRDDGSVAYVDSLRHHRVDTVVSSIATTSILLNPLIIGADSVGGAVAAGASGWLAYKTATNQE